MTMCMSAKTMNFCMVAACHYLKIVWMIIQFVPINVMNYFRTSKTSADNLLHYFSMFKNCCSKSGIAAIPLSVYVPNPLMVVIANVKRKIASLRAKKSFVVFSPAVCLPIGCLAIKTNVILTLIVFFRAAILAEKPILCTCIENGFAIQAHPRKRLTSPVIFIEVQKFLNFHVISPLKKIGAAVVHECLSIHSDPINRKRPGNVVNTYILT